MDIFPQNLSSRHHVELVRRRAARGLGEPNVDDPIPQQKLGLLGRFWAKGSPLTQEQAARGAPAAAIGTGTVGFMTSFMGSILAMIPALIVGNALHNAPLGFATFGAGAAGLTALGYGPLARMIFQKAHRALSIKEVEDLIQRSQDELERSYLQLVRDAILVTCPETAAQQLRDAFTAIGEAIEALPMITAGTEASSLLRDQAHQLQERAAQETDPVIAQSLQRQVETVQQRIDNQEKAALVGRRTMVLRDEIQTKLAALRDVLAAQHSNLVDDRALATLSESARSIARESHNAAAAQAELEGYLDTPQAPQQQRLGGSSS